jgi:RNA polymerase primary sigma factor
LNPRQLHSLARSQVNLPGNQQNAGGRTALAGVARTETIERLLAATRPVISLNAPCPGEGMSTLAEMLSQRDHDEPESDDVCERVQHLVGVLDPREQVVVTLRYGLGGEPRRTLVQIGRVLGVSKERVRQLQNRALNKIRISAERGEPSDRNQPASAGQRLRSQLAARG